MSQKIELEVDVDETGFISGIRKINKEEETHDKNSEKRKKNQISGWKKLGKTIKGVANIYTAVLGAAVVGALGKATKLASDFEESNAKFMTTFALVGKEANKMRNELVNSYNLSSKAATELLSNTGDMLSGFGFAADEALNLAGATNKLAADLASFANVPVKQASDAITKGLLGEREAMKTLGIAILESDVQQRLALDGKDKLTGAALRQAKAEATLALAMEQSKNAIGDVSRTQDSFANRMRQIKATTEDVAVAIGQELLKQVGPTVQKFGEFIKTEEGMRLIGSSVKGIVSAFIILKAVAKTVFDVIALGVKNIVDRAKTLGEAWQAIKNKDFKALKDAIINGNAEITNNTKEAFGSIKDNVTSSFNEINKMWEDSAKLQIKGMNDVASAQQVALQKQRAAAEAAAKKEEETRNKNHIEHLNRIEKEKEAKETQENEAISGAQRSASKISNISGALTDVLVTAYRARADEFMTQQEKMRAMAESVGNAIIAGIESIAAASAAKTEKRISDLEAEREALLESLEFEVDTRNEFSEQLQELEEAELQSELERKQRELDASLAAGDQERADELASDILKTQLGIKEKQRNDEIKQAEADADAKRVAEEARINAEFDKKIRDEKKKAFKKKKAADLVAAGINTAVGITSALGAPFPLNIAMPIIVGAMGAIQMGIIASRPVPEFNQGGYTGVASGGRSPSVDSIPAMLAPEETIFNKGQGQNLHSALDAAGLLSKGSRKRAVANMNTNHNNQKTLNIHGNVNVNQTSDLFDDRINRRLAAGGTFT